MRYELLLTTVYMKNSLFRYLNRIHPRLRSLVVLIMFAASINGCDSLYFGNLETHKADFQGKSLNVAHVSSNLTYNKKGPIPSGIDYDLLQDFSRQLNIKINLITVKSEEEALNLLKHKSVDLAVGRIRTPYYIEDFHLGPAYESTQLELFCRRSFKNPNTGNLENKKVLVLEKDITPELENWFSSIPESTKIIKTKGQSPLPMIKLVLNKTADCFVGEKAESLSHKRHFSTIEKVLTFNKKYSLQWLVSDNNPQLVKAIRLWYQRASRSGLIANIQHRYNAHLDELSHQDINYLNKNIKTNLPEFIALFKKAGKDQNLPWQLLAAVAYQESHWNIDAKSFTGVKGIMQLTTATAEHLGIKDRTNPEESIYGGARYLKQLLTNMPNTLNFKDKLSFALAAYNVGPMHLRDAQKLATEFGKDPWSWKEIKAILPLLSDENYYSKLDYGYARGEEPVAFVDRVHNFYEIFLARL